MKVYRGINIHVPCDVLTDRNSLYISSLLPLSMVYTIYIHCNYQEMEKCTKVQTIFVQDFTLFCHESEKCRAFWWHFLEMF